MKEDNWPENSQIRWLPASTASVAGGDGCVGDRQSCRCGAWLPAEVDGGGGRRRGVEVSLLPYFARRERGKEERESLKNENKTLFLKTEF